MYRQIKIIDYKKVDEIINEYVRKGYKFVSFFYESGPYSLFDTFVLLVKEELK